MRCDTESGQLRESLTSAIRACRWASRLVADGRAMAFVSSRGNQGLTFGTGWSIRWKQSAQHREPWPRTAWSPDNRWVYYSTRGGAAATDAVLKKVPVDGGAAVTVTTERLRNASWPVWHEPVLFVERPLLDGTPEFEIRVATPENAPFRVLARHPASRVPIWQIVKPALFSRWEMARPALTDGLTINLWALSTRRAVAPDHQLGDRTTFIARRVSWSSDGRSILAAVGDGDFDIVLLEGLTSVGRKEKSEGGVTESQLPGGELDGDRGAREAVWRTRPRRLRVSRLERQHAREMAGHCGRASQVAAVFPYTLSRRTWASSFISKRGDPEVFGRAFSSDDFDTLKARSKIPLCADVSLHLSPIDYEPLTEVGQLRASGPPTSAAPRCWWRLRRSRRQCEPLSVRRDEPDGPAATNGMRCAGIRARMRDGPLSGVAALTS